MTEEHARIAGYTLGTIAGFVALAFVIVGFSGCQRRQDELATQSALACINHGGQWISANNGYQCVQPAK